MKKWHISIGNHPNVLKDYNSSLMNSCICIHSTSKEWTENSINIGEGKKGINRIKQFEKFKDLSKEGDIIYLFCNGKIRAKGLYNGVINKILSKEDAEELCPSLPTNLSWIKEKKYNFPIASFKIGVKRWEIYKEPLSGSGKQLTLYEINENNKNFKNYK